MSKSISRDPDLNQRPKDSWSVLRALNGKLLQSSEHRALNDKPLQSSALPTELSRVYISGVQFKCYEYYII
jgi:hypothetical protein